MAELASAAPTSGGVRIYYPKHLRVHPHFFNSCIFGPTPFLHRDGVIFFAGSWAVSFLVVSLTHAQLRLCWRTDANTIGSIASVASIDWGCAVQVMAAATIGSNGSFSATAAQTLYVPSSFFEKNLLHLRKQCCICRYHRFARRYMLLWDSSSCQTTNCLCRSECSVSHLLDSMDLVEV
jgi:hypothetical protein